MDASGQGVSDSFVENLHGRIAAANAHDAAGMAAFYAEDAVFTEATYPGPMHGRAAVQKDAEMIFTAMPDIQLTVVTVVAQGDLVASEIMSVGTNTGPLNLPTGDQLPPSGNTVRVPMALFSRFDADGLIAEEHRYIDLAGMMRQLGVPGP